MLVVESLQDLPRSLKYPVMTIGVFDGVHLGHQTILRRLAERTRERQGTSLLLTFTPHPQKIISPPDAPALLLTSRQKETILREQDIDILVRLPFTRELSLRTPAEFAREVLANHGIREIHVGSNFRFGHGRSGDFRLLQSLGQNLGFEVYEVPQVCFRRIPISSTRVRALLKEGRVAFARRLLNRSYQISGIVVRGAARGVELGFPTANLDAENELIPAHGVYAGRAYANGVAYVSVTNIGFRPTLHQQREGRPVVETHLLDFSGDLYGKFLKLDFCLRLRPERKFESVGALQKQIARDIALTRQYHRAVQQREMPWQSP